MSTTSPGDLRELNELNFARFDAKLERRLAEFEARQERRFASIEAKLGATAANHLVEQAVAQVASTIDRCFDGLQATLEEGLRHQRHLILLGTVVLLVPILGLWFRG